MTVRHLRCIVICIAAFLALSACSAARKLVNIREEGLRASISLPDYVGKTAQIDTSSHIIEDTITVSIDGHDMILMHAVLDEESGEMVAAQELRPAVVSARFRNVAERHGKIDLEFQIAVPEEMRDSRWQLRFNPYMAMLGDTIALDRLIITGEDYRRGQLRGYELYRRFLARIVSDTTSFVDVRNLEIWLQRHIPAAYAYRNDTTFVTEEAFESCFGVTERMAIDHYTDKLAKRRNELRIDRKDRMLKRYVKSPILTECVRLDTVIKGDGGELVYNYVQTINTAANLRKVGIMLSGEIYEGDRRLYSIPESEPLTFYISSLSSLVDRRERYLTRIVERRAEANAAWYIEFRQGSSDIDEDLGANHAQMERIRACVRSLVCDDVFDLDSITVTSFASPEGPEPLNDRLSRLRAAGVTGYFDSFAKAVRDSLEAVGGFAIEFDQASSERVKANDSHPAIRFISRSGGENWFLLDNLVENDSVLTVEQKLRYMEISHKSTDPDERERALSSEPFYHHLKEDLYPFLRTVQFNFCLHRKGMVKDTVHTTVLDTVYMEGVQALADRDYDRALSLLRPYNDYNTAVAYLSLDRNVSAMDILSGLPESANVNYLLAILYARNGDVRQALGHYLTSCSQEPSFVHRGNLDPEISTLIKQYGLNQQ